MNSDMKNEKLTKYTEMSVNLCYADVISYRITSVAEFGSKIPLTVILNSKLIIPMHITRKELFTVIDKLPQNKAAGPGLLTTWSFKCSKMSIGTHLQFAINECISKNIFPDVLKKAYVTPIKKSDPLEAENCRPISVTPTLAKIFERLLPQQMLEHVEKYETINQNQFGFLKKNLRTIQ